MSKNIIASIVKLANMFDIHNMHQEANILTKIAQNLSEDLFVMNYDERLDFLDDYKGSIIRLLRFKEKDTDNILYQTAYRIKNKISLSEPTESLNKALADFFEICDRYPRTPYIHLPEFEKNRPSPGPKKTPADWEPQASSYQLGYKPSRYK